MDWFLYENGLLHERVKYLLSNLEVLNSYRSEDTIICYINISKKGRITVHHIVFIKTRDNKIFQPFLNPLLAFGHKGNKFKHVFCNKTNKLVKVSKA